MNFIYLGALLFSLAGLALIDLRFKLAFGKNAKAATIAIAIPYALFVIWDFVGIDLGIFFKGESKFITGLTIAPHFPVEELFFLAVLCYTTLIVSAGLDRRNK